MQIEEAIADLKYYIGEDPYFNGTYEPVTDFEKYCYNNCKAIDTVLNELEKKEAKIDKLRNTNKDLLKKLRNRVKEVKKLTRYSLYKKEFARLNKQLEKKDKEIDEMAEYIIELIKYNNPEEERDKKEIKEYFYKKVRNGK